MTTDFWTDNKYLKDDEKCRLDIGMYLQLYLSFLFELIDLTFVGENLPSQIFLGSTDTLYQWVCYLFKPNERKWKRENHNCQFYMEKSGIHTT